MRESKRRLMTENIAIHGKCTNTNTDTSTDILSLSLFSFCLSSPPFFFPSFLFNRFRLENQNIGQEKKTTKKQTKTSRQRTLLLCGYDTPDSNKFCIKSRNQYTLPFVQIDTKSNVQKLCPKAEAFVA